MDSAKDNNNNNNNNSSDGSATDNGSSGAPPVGAPSHRDSSPIAVDPASDNVNVDVPPSSGELAGSKDVVLSDVQVQLQVQEQEQAQVQDQVQPEAEAAATEDSQALMTTMSGSDDDSGRGFPAVSNQASNVVESDATVAPVPVPPPTISFEDNATWLSRALVYYLDPLFSIGYKRTLQHEDLGLCAQQDRASILFTSFDRIWAQEYKRPKEKRSLWRVLFRTIGYCRVAEALLLYAGYSALSFGPILILNALTQYLQGSITLSAGQLWVFVCLMFVLPMTGSIFLNQSNNIMAHIGVQFRNVLISMIYRKALRLSPAARQSSSTGQIVTMFSSDTGQIQRFLFFLNNIALALPTIMVALALIYQQVGPATFVGLALMIVLTPASGAIFGILQKVRQAKVKVTDRRVKLMNEVLQGIRILKYYAWQSAFAEKINEIRLEELKLLKKMAYIIAIGFSLVLASTPILQPVVIFYTYAKLGNQLDAAKAFTTIALFNLLQLPFTFLPLGLAQYSQSLVSSKRMLDFFVAEELEPYVETAMPSEGSKEFDDEVIRMDQASLGWMTEEQAATQATEQLAKAVEDKQKTDKRINAATGAASPPANADAAKYEIVAQCDSGDSNPSAAEPLNRSIHTLMDVSVSIHKGQLVAVVGSVGSGKSSFLSALLGEMHRQAGTVRVVGSTAFCDQRPWIINSTVKENVLFGLEEDEERLDLAIHAANLEEDIHILPGGVLTEIGERGINLSGGQKARVALARAVYRNADVYFLDDILSAVDAHVGQHLFEECVLRALEGKTRVLVTHQVHVLPQCDHIVVLQEGRILAQGTYDEIVATGVDFEALVPSKGSKPADDAANATKTSPAETQAKEKLGHANTSNRTLLSSTSNLQSSTSLPGETTSGESDRFAIIRYKSVQALKLASRRKLDLRSSSVITTEERNTGDVANGTYMYYVKSGGIFLFSSVIFFSIVNQVLVIVSSFWLSYWGQVSLRAESNGAPLSSDDNLYYLNIFAVFSCLALVVFMFRGIMLANHRLGTSIKLHLQCLQHVLGAPVAFFDVTPLGRILNRFSSDMAVVDEDLSQSLLQVINSLSSCLGAVGAIAGATKGVFLIVFVPMSIVYERVTKYFRSTNTAVARLESVSRSPIYADFSQALTGLNTIRAYGDQRRFVDSLEAKVDRNSIAAITQQIAGQWLGIRLDLMGSLVTFFIALLAVTSDGFIPPGFMALGLAYSFQLTQFFKFAVRILATLEAQFNSVERIMNYTTELEQEGGGPLEDPAAVPPEWPTQGTIEAINLKMRYREGPLVLNDVNFRVSKGEKCGIAGRTGSGKSSLMVALFRVQELASGSILIDGLDIAKVPLNILRTKLGIIPQDPVMFSATVRFNLDPFSEKTDDEVWSVLESVAIKDHILSLPGKLQEVVSEGGDNFSAGQRQLICIARALLRKPKILVLDEATASIDNETDLLIQNMVRKEFVDSTVLTIAHRLHTIIDSDKILVLDSGKLAEFDAPEKLLQSESGVFKSLWDRHQASHRHIEGGSSANLAALSTD